ncbi:hypothetical protein F4780DRAFT_662857 [Xylariomycetidae sp. FL0641]|nr:hypothetical protein F4780DRAFT_662857 [Xylariomycetidae sp. FL0641]
MGNKSKFTFPVPGRSNKHQQKPDTSRLSISTPLSKAQKILGTGGINIDSRNKESGRSWEGASACGISIAVSESSASQATHDTGLGLDDDGTSQTSYGAGFWEQESEILPRFLRSGHGPPSRKGLKSKGSAVTLSNDGRETATDNSFAHRRSSVASAQTHYEAARMPLAISQQTSNSAMAKGLPNKVSSLLDMDGSLGGPSAKKKKPSKLDLSRLRSRHRKHQNDSLRAGSAPASGVVGNSSSTVSLSTGGSPNLSLEPSPVSHTGSLSKHPYQQAKYNNSGQYLKPGHPQGGRDTSGLNQLYDHYEQMTLRDSGFGEELLEEEEEDPPYLEPRTYQPSPTFSALNRITPLPHPEQGVLGHSRDNSYDSRPAAIKTETAGAPQIPPAAKRDCSASVSSRHTRTSKASPSVRSMMDSDRQQNSVLSLTDSDSDDDEVLGSMPDRSSMSYQASISCDGASIRSDPRPNIAQVPGFPHPPMGRTSNASTFTQLKERLANPPGAAVASEKRSSSSQTFRSKTTSMSTVTPYHSGLTFGHDTRMSVRSTDTMGSTYSGQLSGYGVEEARAVSFVPLASTAEAANGVSAPAFPGHADQLLLRRTDQNHPARRSDQPTPPLSPTSVEFCIKPPGTRPYSTASTEEEEHNARMMAVTRQEEMLLAALRKKRARMRENLMTEVETDRSRRGSTSSSGKGSSRGYQSSTRVTGGKEKSEQPSSLPQQGSSLQKPRHGETKQSSSGPAKKTVPETLSHHQHVLLYLDRPVSGESDLVTADPSPNPSEYTDDGTDYLSHPDHRSRSRSKLGSALGHYNGMPRKDSSVSSRSGPLRAQLDDVPESSQEDAGDDFDDGELDLSAFPTAPSQNRQRPQASPNPGIARPDSPAFLHPSSAEQTTSKPKPQFKSKKSAVRLSAVGRVNSPVPWWGDDD